MGQSASKIADNERGGLGVGFAAGLLLGGIALYSLNSKQKQVSRKCKKSMVGAACNGGLLEYSVVYTDRALNLMSEPFMKIMREISSTLREVYNLDEGGGCAIIPGSGTYAMESVARQFGTEKKCLIIRNGYFSYRWSDIFNVTKIIQPTQEIVIMAQPDSKESKAPAYQPPAIEEVEKKNKKRRTICCFCTPCRNLDGGNFAR